MPPEMALLELDFDEAVRRVIKAPKKLPKGDNSARNLRGTIHSGDCIKVMQTLPAESFRVIVTSPPYNLKNSTGNGMKDGRGGK